MKEALKDFLQPYCEKWLEENATSGTETEPYGDTRVEKDSGYSDSDWERAMEYVKEEVMDILETL